jgi:hypothetical protein
MSIVHAELPHEADEEGEISDSRGGLSGGLYDGKEARHRKTLPGNKTREPQSARLRLEIGSELNRAGNSFGRACWCRQGVKRTVVTVMFSQFVTVVELGYDYSYALLPGRSIVTL